MRTKRFRLHQNKIKDLKRRHLYRNHAICGRFEINPNTEDNSVTLLSVFPIYGKTRYSTVTIAPEKLDNKIGYWQQCPKSNKKKHKEALSELRFRESFECFNLNSFK